MSETIFGTVAAVLLILIYQVLSKYTTAKLLGATTLVAIAFIYLGFSLQTNNPSAIILEGGIALLLYFTSIVGYSKNNILIAYGIIFHGLWDILHHNAFLVKTVVPTYWPSFCFVIDVIDGLYFLFIFKAQNRRLPAQ